MTASEKLIVLMKTHALPLKINSNLLQMNRERKKRIREKHKNKISHGKTYNKSPRRINHKATKSKTNTGTTALVSLLFGRI